MDPLVQAIAEAWKRVKPLVEKDPDERARRLARRRLAVMQRPPRAWCLAVRASDTRINPATAACVPEEAAYPRSALGTRFEPEYSEYGPHEVTLTAQLVRRLVRPYYIPAPGISARELAEKLGCSRGRIAHIMNRGHFTVEYYKQLTNGQPGPPVPRVYTEKQLDSGASRCAQAQDALWGTNSTWLDSRVPDDLEQTIERVPNFQEYPVRGESPCMLRVFRGWKWICPGCRKTTRTLFYPLPRVYAFQLLDREPAPGEVDGMPEPPNSFACVRCHRVRYFSRWTHNWWNQLITHISGGMLFGYEVPEQSLVDRGQRSRAYKPRFGCAPSKRREEVLERLLKGLKYREIARDLGISMGTVSRHKHVIYAQHRVHSRAGLAKALGVKMTVRDSRMHDTVKHDKVTR
jgi:DNA-binding CsgD family transcriptional regulator